MSDQEVMSELVSLAQERIRYRDLIRELVECLETSICSGIPVNGCVGSGSCICETKDALARAKEELGDE